jgi:hypothetical protein
MRRLLERVAEQVHVRCVTRWHPLEVAQGVSDLEVWCLIKGRPNSSLLLRSDLHAKYYRADTSAVVGSANLTQKALGWVAFPNLELLVPSQPLPRFEQELVAASLEVTDLIYEDIRSQAAELGNQLATPVDTPGPRAEEGVVPPVSQQAWLPSLRHPEKLYLAYGSLDPHSLPSATREASRSDLDALDLPAGLTEEQFRAHVRMQLLQKPCVHYVMSFIGESQRFGAVRDYLNRLPCAHHEHFDSARAWQTLMRWLLEFFPDRYEVTIANYSEVIRCTNTSRSTGA